MMRSTQRIRDDDEDEDVMPTSTEMELANPLPPVSPSQAVAGQNSLTVDPTLSQDADATGANSMGLSNGDLAGDPSTGEPVASLSEDVAGVDLRSAESGRKPDLRTIQQRRPDDSLSKSERREIAARHLQEVADALLAYARDNKRLPPTYLSANGFQTLSWRVEILPYLGYKKLYEKFDKNVPWNRPPNDALLNFIPDVYTSPERFDTSTNILMPACSGFIGGDGGGSVLNDDVIEDGVANTLLLVEVNDDHAVPWTAPQDFEPEDRDDAIGLLFDLREEGVFAVWANGWTTLLAAGTSSRILWDALTIEAGDGLVAGKLHQDIPISNVSDVTAIAEQLQPTAGEDSGKHMVAPDTDIMPRGPVPSAGEMSAVRERLRQIFAAQLERAKLDQGKRELAREMLAQALIMSEDSMGAYALQTAAMRLAIDSGGVSELVQGIDQRVARFEVDALDENMTWILEFGRGVAQRDVKTINGMDFVRRAVRVIHAAIHDDQYMNASTLARYSFRMINEDRDERLPRNFTRLRGLLGQAKRDFDSASQSLAAYRLIPSDGGAAADVGRFLCFIKGDWQRGLPLLTEGGSEALRELAARDLQGASNPSDQIAIGDAWWELAEQARRAVYRHSALERAKFWYEQAYEVMPESLDRLHVKTRLDGFQESSSTSPLAMIQDLADEVGVDLSIGLVSIGKTSPLSSGRSNRQDTQSRDEANEG
ncbi:MAG: DUF1559 domain-containing protein [Rubripirellula sp.]|nr:DUF1559 domain-containing protein [Rubripirellula sp.]